MLSACGFSPNEEKIKGDLIGRTITTGGEGPFTRHWRFDSLSEFESFSIVDKKSSGDIIEYTVQLTVNDHKGDMRSGTCKIVYRKESGEWKIANVLGW
jgi:hypothetical protein